MAIEAEPAKVSLIPWDPESPSHLKRLYDQRVACGWKYEAIESWRPLQREGKMTIQWITLPPSSPTTSDLLSRHTTKHPLESTPLSDTATSFGGQPRQPSLSTSFIPIGHISLDTYSPFSAKLADPSRGIYCISTFYISAALQSSGLGRATMDLIEQTATSPPLNAKVLTLNTLAKEEYGRSELWEALEWPVPELGTQAWYERRGYTAFEWHEKAFSHFDRHGREWWMKDVCMRKDVG